MQLCITNKFKINTEFRNFLFFLPVSQAISSWEISFRSPPPHSLVSEEGGCDKISAEPITEPQFSFGSATASEEFSWRSKNVLWPPLSVFVKAQRHEDAYWWCFRGVFYLLCKHAGSEEEIISRLSLCFWTAL
jgi:hypothetical protein